MRLSKMNKYPIDSTLFMEALIFLKSHPTFCQYINKRDGREDLLIESISLRLLSLDDYKMIMEVRVEYNVFSPSMPPKDELAARLEVNLKTGHHKLLQVQVYEEV